MRSSRKFTRFTILFLAVAGLLGTSLAVAPLSAQAAGTTYYVDNSSGSGCSDSNAGTSSTAPWCTFTPANSLTLGAGDSLLLARGDSWAQELTLTMTGTAAAVATLGAYGTGAAPEILANSSNTGIALTNPNNAVVTGLDIGQHTSQITGGLAYGVVATYTTLGNSNLTFTNLNVHDNWQIGVFVRSTATQSITQTALTGLTFSNITTSHNAQGIAIAGQGTITDEPATPTPTADENKIFENVLVDNIYQSHDDADQAPNRVSAFGVPCVGLTLQDASNIIVRNSILDSEAGCRTGVGTTSLFLGVVNGVILANNEIINTPNTENSDMTAIDYEARTYAVTVAGNYFANNYGGALEYLAIHGTADYDSGHLTTANVFENNGVAHTIPYTGYGAITQLGGSIVPSATISDNLYSEPFGFTTADDGGTISGFTSTNNISIDSTANIYAAEPQFNSSPWGYQSGSGSSWTALTYNSTTNNYTGSGVTIDKSTLTPSASTGAGVTWTAPKSGVISIRGAAITNSGTASALVTQNGTSLTSATVPTTGAILKVDDLAVTAGDVIRFSVAAGASTVSWAPSVAYTSASSGSDGPGQWTFSVAGNTEGWTSNAAATIQRGYATVTTPTGTTDLDSADGLGLSATTYTALRLTYSNNTSATAGRVYFNTSTGQSFSTTRSVTFNVNPKTTGAGTLDGFQTVIIPLSGNSNWTGTIQRLQVELTSVSGTFLVSAIQLTKPAVASWEFSSASGWTFNPNIDCATTGTASASPVIDVNNTTGTFTPYADINWSDTRMQEFTVSTPRLAQIDLWAYKSGLPAGCLYLRVIKITDPTTQTGPTLFTGAIAPSAVSILGGFVSVYPGLTGLDTSAKYGLEIFNPYVVPGSGTYGIAFSDSTSNPASGFGEYWSVDNNGTWLGPETNRSLEFRTWSAPVIAPQNPLSGYSTLAVSGGVTSSTGGYEPALLSPSSLGIAASSVHYIHIRMNNPNNRATAYLLFTTSTSASFDQPGDGSPAPNEAGNHGIDFSLIPGSAYHDYTLDMSTVSGWTGTIQQIMLEPGARWSYRVGSLSATWSGAIDYIRFD